MLLGRLLYRITTPDSVCQYTYPVGIPSGVSLERVSCDPEPFDIRCDVPDPDEADNYDLIIRHIRGDDDLRTPFVSTTSEFYRALSLASHKFMVNRSLRPERVFLFVINSDMLDEDSIDVRDYLQKIPSKNRRDIEKYNIMRATSLVNHEVLIRKGVPQKAIVKMISIAELLPKLPVWVRERYEMKLLRSTPGVGSTRRWILRAADLYDRFKRQGGDPEEACVQMVKVLLNFPDSDASEYDYINAAVLADDLSQNPSVHSGIY